MDTPTYMYRLAKDGSVEAQIFDSESIPAGWVDTPAKLKNAAKPLMSSPASTEADWRDPISVEEPGVGVTPEQRPRKRGRPAKA